MSRWGRFGILASKRYDKTKKLKKKLKKKRKVKFGAKVLSTYKWK